MLWTPEDIDSGRTAACREPTNPRPTEGESQEPFGRVLRRLPDGFLRWLWPLASPIDRREYCVSAVDRENWTWRKSTSGVPQTSARTSIAILTYAHLGLMRELRNAADVNAEPLRTVHRSEER